MASRSCQRVRPHSAAVSTADRPASKNQSASRKLREKRVKSALESRREQEASAVFPEVQRDPEWGVTKYSEDYGPKKRITPVPVRPSSPTRMNNPHPAKPFLTWIHPTRIHQHSKASMPPQDAWKYIKERFYDDYIDTSNTGDAHNEVPITNLAKINFPGERKQNGLCSMPHLAGIAGTKLHLNTRAPKDVLRDSKGSRSHIMTKIPTPLESRAMQATVSTNALPVFKQWLGVASSQEREVIMRMIQAGYTDSEEARLKKAVSEVLQPESVTKIEDWLKSASEAERQVALKVLEQLAIATIDMTDSQYHPPKYFYASGFGHHRSHTYPVSLSRHQVPQRHTHQQKTKCRHCSSGDERRRKRRIDNGGLGLIGKRIATQSKTECSPQLWHNRILKKHGGATVIHAGGIFDQPKKDRGQHFDIHPEWPTV